MEETKYTPESLARLPREELRRILAEELRKDMQHIDDDFVRLLLAELQNRGNDPEFTDDDEVEAACEKFREDMVPIQTHRRYWYQSWMLKVASVVLVLGILFFALPAAAKAGNVKDVLGWWSDSVFRVFVPGEKPLVQDYVYETDHPGLQQIYDAVTELGITQQIVPQKLSKEFELTEIKTLHFLGDTTIYAHLASNNHEYAFSAVVHSDQPMYHHEKTEDNISVWELVGTEHYVISNTEDLTVTWVVGNIECTVITDCPIEDTYVLIKSIYTSED